MAGLNAPKCWYFGRTELDERGEVRVAGSRIALEAASFRVLLALLRHAGEVVTKDELLESAWPGRLVAENSLAKAISRLRHSLGEDGNAIRAVYGYGYRLAVPVRVQEIPGEVAAVDGLEGAQPRPGEALPLRPEWRMVRRLGQGSAGATVLARSVDGEERVFKFALGEAGLRGLRREVVLSRYLEATLPDRSGITPLLGWNLSQPPFYVEMPFYPEGNLREFDGPSHRLKSFPLLVRIELAAQICDAVAALHGAGVIHRDLKPENLYAVPDANAPHGWRMVLGDFGLGDAARSPQLAELGLTMSLVGSADEGSSGAGSVLYLAPEIIAGETATQSSDVYALGVLLHQLVVADLRRPLAPGWESDVECELLREDIALAAAAKSEQRLIDARGLAHRLRTLEARQRASEEQRQRRAQAELQAQRLKQVEKRRKMALTALALVSAMLAVVGWMYVYAQRALDLAQRTAMEKQELVQFFASRLLTAADPYATGHGNVLLHQALEAAAPLIEADFAGQPSVALSLHEIIGDMYLGMGRYPQGAEQYRQALHSYESLRRTAPDPSKEARLHGNVCYAYHSQGEYEAAIAECGIAERILQQANLPTTAMRLERQVIDYERGRCDSAIPPLREMAEAFDDRAYDLENRDGEFSERARYYLAQCLQELGQVEEAERQYRKTIAIRRIRYGEQSPRLGWALTDLGLLLIELGRLDEAQQALEQGNGIFTRNLDPGNPDRVQAEYGLALLHMKRGDPEAALPILERVLESEVDVLGSRHRWTLETLSDLTLAMAQSARDDDGRRNARETLARTIHEVDPLLAGFGTRATWFLWRWIDTALALSEGELARQLIERQENALELLDPTHPRRGDLQRQRERSATL